MTARADSQTSGINRDRRGRWPREAFYGLRVSREFQLLRSRSPRPPRAPSNPLVPRIFAGGATHAADGTGFSVSLRDVVLESCHMRDRFLPSIGVLAAAIVVVSLVAVPVASQTPPPAAKTAAKAKWRTPWGDPGPAGFMDERQHDAPPTTR
jgi:hypothetical protein